MPITLARESSAFGCEKGAEVLNSMVLKLPDESQHRFFQSNDLKYLEMRNQTLSLYPQVGRPKSFDHQPQAELLGLQGEINVQGEDQKKLDARTPGFRMIFED